MNPGCWPGSEPNLKSKPIEIDVATGNRNVGSGPEMSSGSCSVWYQSTSKPPLIIACRNALVGSASAACRMKKKNEINTGLYGGVRR